MRCLPSDPTTLATVHLREDRSAAYSFHANGTADRGLRPEHLAALPDGGALPAGTALQLGSLGLLLEPLASTLDNRSPLSISLERKSVT
ncbi:hypothetical protein G5C60_02180 [Streptomyces sp. HC44]|uniref:Uncharacterized protein n=1 Tax=Streptomyces scabichelini TaxID=2711217 RepID=A0A6G4UXM8_9ACTN|nr:hypothetical protein [Streptomyces scabichelini]NGO06511.1 hypothetical protein [Streptomyces scabichelini]